MFERFNDHGRRVIIFARQEAKQRLHNQIDTEHLALALLDEETGKRMLHRLGLPLEEIRREIESRLQPLSAWNVRRWTGGARGILPAIWRSPPRTWSILTPFWNIDWTAWRR